LLAFSLEVPKNFPGISQDQLEFKESEVGTQMTFQQTGADPGIVEASWRRMFTQLAKAFLQG